jgi:hypothetical protein
VQRFELGPFSAKNLPEIKILGTVDQFGNQLHLEYEVYGDVNSILLPQPSTPVRQDDLWKTSCFEFFIAVPNAPRYWEFNMSPSGQWNVYCMDAYRRVGFREESAFHQLPFEFRKVETGLYLEIFIDLQPIIPFGQTIEIGIAAVIQAVNSQQTFWALVHPGEQADFHSRDSFVIEL